MMINIKKKTDLRSGNQTLFLFSKHSFGVVLVSTTATKLCHYIMYIFLSVTRAKRLVSLSELESFHPISYGKSRRVA